MQFLKTDNSYDFYESRPTHYDVVSKSNTDKVTANIALLNFAK